MSALYIKEQGATVAKRGERILIMKNRRELLDIPVENIDNIAIIGNVQVSTQALHMLMEKGVDLSYGKYIGHTMADSSKNVFLRFAQHELYQDIPKRMDMARTIVENKIQNQVSLIRHYRWTDGYDWKADTKQLERLCTALKEKQTPNELLGIEGKCSNIYFGAYGHMFKSKIKFSGRNRRPPRDPVNVMLSLGYTFLTRDVSAALEAESFEMYLGFLHGIRYGRKSLALDMVEEFRQPVVDRMVLQAFNKGMFSERDFEMERESIVLEEEGFAKFCQLYERWMKDSSYSCGQKGYHEQIRLQAKNLKKMLQKGESYCPYRWKGDS